MRRVFLEKARDTSRGGRKFRPQTSVLRPPLFVQPSTSQAIEPRFFLKERGKKGPLIDCDGSRVDSVAEQVVEKPKRREREDNDPRGTSALSGATGSPARPPSMNRYRVVKLVPPRRHARAFIIPVSRPHARVPFSAARSFLVHRRNICGSCEAVGPEEHEERGGRCSGPFSSSRALPFTPPSCHPLCSCQLRVPLSASFLLLHPSDPPLALCNLFILPSRESSWPPFGTPCSLNSSRNRRIIELRTGGEIIKFLTSAIACDCEHRSWMKLISTGSFCSDERI